MEKSVANKILGLTKLQYNGKNPWVEGRWTNHDPYEISIPKAIDSLPIDTDFLRALLVQNRSSFEEWGEMDDSKIIIPTLKTYDLVATFNGSEIVKKDYGHRLTGYDEADVENRLNNCDPCWDEGDEIDVEWYDREGDWELTNVEQVTEDINHIKNVMGLITEQKNNYKNRLNESKMSEIDLEGYKKKALEEGNNEWVDILDRFPDEFQREIIDERPEGSKSDINLIKNWELDPNYPITMNLLNLLQTKSVKEAIGRTPRHVMEMIKTNPRYRLELEDVEHVSDTEIGREFGLKSGEIFDQNPKRYEEYANYDPKTAEPSTMVNGELWWGMGRLIAALLRGDMTLKVWSVTDNRGIMTDFTG